MDTIPDLLMLPMLQFYYQKEIRMNRKNSVFLIRYQYLEYRFQKISYDKGETKDYIPNQFKVWVRL